MIFQKKALPAPGSALRPACTSWGGQALFLSNRDLQIGRGEPVQDTARVLSRYLDGIMIRTFAQKEVEDLAEYGSHSHHQRPDRLLPPLPRCWRI